MKRAALYLRISKKPTGARAAEDGDTSYSVDDQRVRCEALCAAAGYEIAAVFYDDGVSAYRSLKDRPGYGELREAIDAKAFEVLVFDRQDRLARDQRETMRFIIRCGDSGTEWHSAQEGSIDLNDTMAVMFAIFRGGEAQAYSDKISKNQKHANIRKRDRGLPGAGGRPFGFEADKITVRPQEADLIRQGTQMILAGSARWDILRAFRDSGVKSVRGNEWHVASVIALLRRWRNAGYVEHADQPHAEAVWPAIVSKDDVHRVRAILDQRRTPGRWKQPTRMCSGIAMCRCGLSLYVCTNDGVPAYRCSGIVRDGKNSPGGHVTIRAAFLESVVRRAVIDTYFTRPTSNSAGAAESEQLVALYERRETARAARRRAQDGYEKEIYSASEAAGRVAAADVQISAIDAEIDAAAARSAHTMMLQESSALLWADAAATSETGPWSPAASLIRSYTRRGFTQDEAITAATYRYWKDHPERSQAREKTGQRFDALPLAQQRQLVASLLTVNVSFGGRGADRVRVQPRAVEADSPAMADWRRLIDAEERAERRVKITNTATKLRQAAQVALTAVE